MEDLDVEWEYRSSAVVIAGVCPVDISSRCLVATPALRLSWGSPVVGGL